MAHVASPSITELAMDAILRRCDNPAAERINHDKPIPLLLWAKRSYFDDKSGRRTEFGPQFYFYWTDNAEIKKYDYVKIEIVGGRELALAPGELFRSGSQRIDLKGDKLALVD